MKVLFSAGVAVVLSSMTASTQTVQFFNSALSKISYEASPGAGLQDAPAGTVVGIFYGTSADSLNLSQPTASITTPGLFNGGSVYTLAGATPAQSVYLKVAAWYNANGLTPSLAHQGPATPGITHYGESAVVQTSPLGAAAGPGAVIWQSTSGTSTNRAKPFTLQQVGPDINVTGNGVSILSGDNTPSVNDHTDFGITTVGGATLTRTFTIQNLTSPWLSLSLLGNPRVVVSGVNAADFTVTGQPYPTVSPSNATTFVVICHPASIGIRVATLSINSSDSDEPIYTFSIHGTGATAPQISSPSGSVLSTNGGLGLLTAQLSALINPNGAPTTVSFEYGTNTTYALSNSIPSQAAAFGNTSVTNRIFLAAGYIYHWRVSAGNLAATNSSFDQILDLRFPVGLAGDVNGDGAVTQTEMDAVYSNFVTNSPWLLMTNVAGLGGSNVTFAVTNSVLGSYSVQYSTNLINWLPLGTPATPRFGFIDTNAPSTPQRYYRLVYP